jgi:hypothetical protein
MDRYQLGGADADCPAAAQAAQSEPSTRCGTGRVMRGGCDRGGRATKYRYATRAGAALCLSCLLRAAAPPTLPRRELPTRRAIGIRAVIVGLPILGTATGVALWLFVLS